MDEDDKIRQRSLDLHAELIKALFSPGGSFESSFDISGLSAHKLHPTRWLPSASSKMSEMSFPYSGDFQAGLFRPTTTLPENHNFSSSHETCFAPQLSFNSDANSNEPQAVWSNSPESNAIIFNPSQTLSVCPVPDLPPLPTSVFLRTDNT